MPTIPSSIERHPATMEDNLRARSIQTQAKVLSRTAMVVVLLAGASMALIALFGIDGMGEGIWYQAVLGLTQAPGIIILTSMGFCCGFADSTIISEMIVSHWGGIVRAGIPALVAANWNGLGLHGRGTLEAYNKLASKEKCGSRKRGCLPSPARRGTGVETSVTEVSTRCAAPTCPG